MEHKPSDMEQLRSLGNIKHFPLAQIFFERSKHRRHVSQSRMLPLPLPFPTVPVESLVIFIWVIVCNCFVRKVTLFGFAFKVNRNGLERRKVFDPRQKFLAAVVT